MALAQDKVSWQPSLPRLNREHKETCERDWSDKVEAYNIDDTCSRYHNQSTEVQFHPHSAAFEERWAMGTLLTQPSGRRYLLRKGSCARSLRVQ